MKNIILVTTCFLISFQLYAQRSYQELMLDNSVNYYDVCKAADEYFTTHDKDIKGSGWKGYERWKYDNESKYAPSGVRDNIDPLFVSKEYLNFIKLNPVFTRRLNASGWNDLGPYRIDSISGAYSTGLGRVVASYVHRSNPSIMYLGSRSGGFWRTVDGGATWQVTTDYLPASGVGSITASPTNADSVLINVQNGGNNTTHGIYRSTDGGKTWKVTKFNPSNLGKGGLGSNFKINKVVYHPRVSNLIFITASDGLYRSTDNLATWSKITSGSISEIDFHPTDNNIIYIYDYYYWNNNQDYVFRSLDQGLTFTKSTSIAGNARSSGHFSVSTACDDCMYFASSNGVWVSKDTAKTFTFLSNPPQSCLGFAVNDLDTSKMVYGYVDVETSSDGGRSFNQVSWWSLGNSNHGTGDYQYKLKNSGKYIHADLHPAISIKGVYYVGTDGFFCKSSNNGATWEILSQGVGIRENYCLGASQSNHYRSISGSQDNGTSIKHQSTWIEFNGGDGMEGIIHPLNDDWMIGSYQYGSRFRTKNGGLSSSGVTPPNQGGAGKGDWVAPLVYDPNNHMHIYNFSEFVYKSKNFGTSWDSIGKPTFGGLIGEAAIAEINSNIIIASRGSAMEKSIDGGVSFSSIKALHATDTLPDYTITDIAFNPRDDNTIVVTYDRYNNDGKKIFLTTDGGKRWLNITYNLGNMPLHGAVIDHSYFSYIYVAAEIGVYVKSMTDTTWALYNKNLPNSSIRELEIVNGSNTIKAAIWGRGVWEYTLKDRVNYPAIVSTRINNMPADDLPKEGVDQFVTSKISYAGKLSKVYVKWSINSLKFDSTILMTNSKDSTWKSNNSLPKTKAGDKVYFKVYAISISGELTETYKFMYEIKPFVYCNASGSNDPNPYLKSVRIANVLTASIQTQYKLFSNDMVYLMRDSLYTITLSGSTNWSSNDYGAWIDYDNNATFDDADSIGFSTGGNTFSRQFSVPRFTNITDTIRLRTRVSYWGDKTNSCGTTLGEVEDYPVIVFTPPNLQYSFIDSNLCDIETLNYSYIGDAVDSVHWTIFNGEISFQSKTNNGTLNAIPEGIYNVKLEGYKYGYYFTETFDSAFNKNDSTSVWIYQTSCNPLDTGLVIKTYKNVAGCDSIVKTKTILLPKSEVKLNTTSCNPQDTGTDMKVYQAANGCDSIVTTITTLLPSSSTTINLNTCSTLDSGSLTQNIKGVNGCDSVVITIKTYTGVKASIVAETNILKAYPLGMDYQWLNCSDNLKEVIGATNQIYNVLKDGNYAVSVSNQNCIDTSACESIVYVGLVNNNFLGGIELYPNPTDGKLLIAFGKTHDNISIKVVNALGSVVHEQVYKDNKSFTIDISKLPSGVYLITLSENEKSVTYKILKK